MDAKECWDRALPIMKKHGFTQRSLSLACGLTERRIETLIARKGFPDADEALKIAQALHTSVEYLVTGIEPKNSKAAVLDDLQAFINSHR